MAGLTTRRYNVDARLIITGDDFTTTGHHSSGNLVKVPTDHPWRSLTA